MQQTAVSSVANPAPKEHAIQSDGRKPEHVSDCGPLTDEFVLLTKSDVMYVSIYIYIYKSLQHL